jgi:integrase/recombinase XerD
MADIHKYKQRLKRTLERVEESSEVSRYNKKLILEFHNNCLIQGLSMAKIERYAYDAFRFAMMYKKDLDNATEQDLKNMVAEIEKKEWTISTKQTFKLSLRKFYKFVDKIDEKGISPERLKWMKTHIRRDQKRAPEDLITEKEIELLIRHSTCKRDMAFIASLAESGCRIGELGPLKIKDVVFDEHGARIQVFGKTGSRVVRLITTVYILVGLAGVYELVMLFNKK